MGRATLTFNELRKTIGPYEVREVIGHGGMATVYRAYEPMLDRIVAIKVLQPAFVNDAAFRFRFEREARLVARLRHPHIVGIFNVGEDGGVPYLVMEYLEGPTLHKVLRERVRRAAPYTPAEAVQLLTPVAAALDYAHGQGIIHRDLKPENIILTANGPVLTDFGLAKLVQDEAATVSMVMGTPSYMAPEQIQAQPVDRRTDVYALGILLFELLTGQTPFSGPTPFAVAQAHLSQSPPSLASRQPSLASAPGLDGVVRKALAKSKAERWPTAGAMLAALASVAGTAPEDVPRSGSGSRPQAGAQPTAGRALPAPLAQPRRLRPPSDINGPAGRLVLLLPLVVLLLAGLWVASVWARRAEHVGEDAAARATAQLAQQQASPAATRLAVSSPSSTTEATATTISEAAVTSTSTMSPPDAIPTVVPPGTVRLVVNAGTGAYVRSGPGVAYPQVAGLPYGAVMTATGQSNGWLQITADTGEQGWIAASLVAVQAGVVNTLPVAVAPPPPIRVAPTVPPVPAFAPTVAPAPAVVPTAAPAVISSGGAGSALRLEDTNFTGGFRNRGASIYGGRTATWIYGQGSGFSEMSASFTVTGPLNGIATLTIEGMDSEDAAKTPIRIVVDGVTLLEALSPFPNDDQPLQTGRWASYSWSFDSSILRAGANTVTITNLAGGSKGLPPFVAVDYAVIRLP